jgi:hypothetical protein
MTTEKTNEYKRITTKCPQCRIILFDQPQICPLCQCVIEETDSDDEAHIRELFGENAPYPDIEGRRKKMRLALKVVLFIFVVAEFLMIMINRLTAVSYPWSLITGVALLYIYLSLMYWISYDSGFASKVGLQIVLTSFLLFAIDYFNGMRGWSLEWAIPGIILLGDLIVAVLMLINRSRWQSYLLLLLLLAIFSFILIILYLCGVISNILMPLISEAVSFLYLFVMILFGERKAEHEFSRRFHI